MVRIWSLHPHHLDRVGLVACWRETLLAQAVLAGRTKGYLNHPQLERFRNTSDPLATVASYLAGLAAQADLRGYRFDRSRIIADADPQRRLSVTSGQVDLEWQHLGAKLAVRSPQDHARWVAASPTAHPLFVVVEGPVESWERADRPAAT